MVSSTSRMDADERGTHAVPARARFEVGVSNVDLLETERALHLLLLLVGPDSILQADAQRLGQVYLRRRRREAMVGGDDVVRMAVVLRGSGGTNARGQSGCPAVDRGRRVGGSAGGARRVRGGQGSAEAKGREGRAGRWVEHRRNGGRLGAAGGLRVAARHRGGVVERGR